LEKLLPDRPTDPRIHRYLSDSLGILGLGCCYDIMGRWEEAVPHYRRAVQLRRDLVRGTGFTGDADAKARENVAGDSDDVTLLVRNTLFLADLLESKRRVAEAQSLRDQLVDDIKAVAARFAGPEFQERRQMWAKQLAYVWSGELPPRKLSPTDPGARKI